MVRSLHVCCALIAIVVAAGCSGESDESSAEVSESLVEFDAPDLGVPDTTAAPDPEPEEVQASAIALPDGWPSDVVLADAMQCESVTRVRDDFMVTFHAPGMTIEDVMDWFRDSMASNGWESNGETRTPGGAILSFKKDDRVCGISITDFVLTPSMQRDETIKGITIQTPAQP